MKRCTVYDFQTVPAICKRRYIDELGLFLCLDMISYYVLIDTRAVAGWKDFSWIQMFRNYITWLLLGTNLYVPLLVLSLQQRGPNKDGYTEWYQQSSLEFESSRPSYVDPRIVVRQSFFCLMHELNPQKCFLRILAWKTHPGTETKLKWNPCFGYEKSFGTQSHLERSVSVCFIKISIFPISFSNGKMDI